MTALGLNNQDQMGCCRQGRRRPTKKGFLKLAKKTDQNRLEITDVTIGFESAVLPAVREVIKKPKY